MDPSKLFELIASLEKSDQVLTEDRISLYFQQLIPFRTLFIIGQVNEAYVNALTKAIVDLRAQSRKPIILYINSTGGFLPDGEAIANLIIEGASRGRIIGIVTKEACSAAFNILQACHTRLAYPKAELMFHGFDLADLRIDDPRLWPKIILSQQEYKNMLASLAKRSGQPLRKLRIWSQDEKIFTALEARKLGFIDRVVRRKPANIDK